MNSSNFCFNIIYIPALESTNSYAHQLLEEKKVHEGTIIYTNFQKKGRGQFNNGWDSDSGKNLLMSLILKPSINIEDRFAISEMMALSICDLLDSLSVGLIQIKWPNDILVNRKKIAGILIENSIQGTLINTSILGMGLNVNQEQFDDYQREATSLKRINDEEFSIQELLQKLMEKIEIRYIELKSNRFKIHQDYLKRLYGYGVSKKYEDAKGEFSAVIKSVQPNGQLQLLKDKDLVNYDLKEIRFLD